MDSLAKKQLEDEIESLREYSRMQADSISTSEGTLMKCREQNSDLILENRKLGIAQDGLMRDLKSKNEEFAILQQMYSAQDTKLKEFHESHSSRLEAINSEHANTKVQLRLKSLEVESLKSSVNDKEKSIVDCNIRINQLQNDIVNIKNQFDRDLKDKEKFIESEKNNISAFIQSVIDELSIKHIEEISQLKAYYELQLQNQQNDSTAAAATAREEASHSSSNSNNKNYSSSSNSNNNNNSASSCSDALIVANFSNESLVSSLRSEIETYSQDLNNHMHKLKSKEREYDMISESFKIKKQDYSAVLSENERLGMQLSVQSKDINNYKQEITILNNQNADLSTQLQHLLWKQSESGKLHAVIGSGAGVGPVSVVSKVNIFEDVSDLQAKNAELIKSNHSLNCKVEELKQARIRMENMIAELGLENISGIGNSSDSYNNETSISIDSKSDSVAELFTSSLNSKVSLNSSTSKLSSDSDNSIFQLEQQSTISSLSQRILKLEEAEKFLRTALDKSNSECLDRTKRSSELENDIKSYKNQIDSLEKKLKDLNSKLSEASNKTKSSDCIAAALKSDNLSKDEQIKNLNKSLTTANEQCSTVGIKLEVAKAAEMELLQLVKSYNEKINHQNLLLDAVNRIESNLSMKSSDELRALQTEREKLLSTIDGLRREAAEKNLLIGQAQKLHEEENKLKKTKMEAKTAELSKVREELVREQTSALILQDRNKGLERQLQISEDQVKHLQTILNPLHGIGSSYINPNTEALSEIESLTAKLALEKSHCERYKQLFEQSEDNFKDISENLKTKTVEFESTKNTLLSENEELSTINYNCSVELASLRESFDLKEGQFISEIRGLNDRIESLLGGSLAQLEALKSDAVRFQSMAKISNANYEKEFEKRSAIEKELIAVQSANDSMKSRLQTAEKAMTDALYECGNKDKQCLEFEKSSESVRSDSNKRVAELSQINDILHSQMLTLSRQVEKYGSSGTVDNDLEESRKTCAELREVLRYMKREREIVEAKFSAAESECSRHFSSLQAAHRVVDELRTELKILMDKGAASKTDEDFNSLMSELNKANNFKEDNFKLKYEIESLKKQLSNVDLEFSKLKESQEPNQKVKLELNKKIESLEVEKLSLAEQRDQYKDRLQKLSDNYKEFDTDYNNLKSAKATLTSRCEELEKTQKTLQESAETKADQLRERMRVFQQKNEEFKASNKSLETSMSEKDSVIIQLKSEVASLATSSKSLSTNVNSLQFENSELRSQIAKKDLDLAGLISNSYNSHSNSSSSSSGSSSSKSVDAADVSSTVRMDSQSLTVPTPAKAVTSFTALPAPPLPPLPVAATLTVNGNLTPIAIKPLSVTIAVPEVTKTVLIASSSSDDSAVAESSPLPAEDVLKLKLKSKTAGSTLKRKTSIDLKEGGGGGAGGEAPSNSSISGNVVAASKKMKPASEEKKSPSENVAISTSSSSFLLSSTVASQSAMKNLTPAERSEKFAAADAEKNENAASGGRGGGGVSTRSKVTQKGPQLVGAIVGGGGRGSKQVKIATPLPKKGGAGRTVSKS